MVPAFPVILQGLPDELAGPRQAALARLAGGLVLGKDHVDDAKLTDHHALVPTGQRPTTPLPAVDKKVYDLVAARFLAAFLPEALRTDTSVLLKLGPHALRAHGSVVKEAGWMVAVKPAAADESDVEDREQSLPPLAVGDEVKKREVRLVDKATKAPPRFTEAALLQAMEHAGRSVSDKTLAEFMAASGLGTPATRGAIIGRLIQSEYIVKKARRLQSTAKAQALIDQVDAELKDPALTAERERELAEIEQGRLRADEFDNKVASDVRRLVAAVGAAAPIAAASGATTKTLGSCPKCRQGEVRGVRQGAFFGCNRYKEGCDFKIPGEILDKPIGEKHVLELLTQGRTSLIRGFKSRNTGRKFEARLKLDAGFRTAFAF
jgi:DNA topoisomerase-3